MANQRGTRGGARGGGSRRPPSQSPENLKPSIPAPVPSPELGTVDITKYDWKAEARIGQMKVLRDKINQLEAQARNGGSSRDYSSIEKKILDSEAELGELEKKSKNAPQGWGNDEDVTTPDVPPPPPVPPTIDTHVPSSSDTIPAAPLNQDPGDFYNLRREPEFSPEGATTGPQIQDEGNFYSPRNPNPAGGRPWRKEDASLNEPVRNEHGSQLGRNRTLEGVANGSGRPDKVAFAEYLKNQKERDALVEKRREARSEAFAEKHGLTELRNAKIAAEREAYLENKDHHRNVFMRLSPSARRRRSEAQARADKATLEWNKALAHMPDTLSKREKLEALILRKRDTIIGPNALRTKARIDAMGERDQTSLGKFLKGAGFVAKSPFLAMSKVSSGIGAGLFKMFGNKNLKGADLERSQARWRKAGQVIMGATLGTAIGIAAGPGGLVAAAGIAGYTTFRAITGVGLGTLAGKGAGFVNKHTFDKSTKEDYRGQVRNTDVETVHGMQVQQLAEKHGSRDNRKKRDQKIRVGAAVLTGGLVSLELGQFAHLPCVQQALHDLPPGAHVGTPAPRGELLELKIGGPNAENVNLNDADKLFGHFGKLLERDFTNVPHGNIPAVDSYLKLLEIPGKHGVSLHGGEDHMSQAFGFEKGRLSEIMHKDDTVMLNDHNQIVLKWADGRPPHVLINADGGRNMNVGDLSEHMRAVHSHEAHVAHAGHSGEGAPSTAAHGGEVPAQPTYKGLAEAVADAKNKALEKDFQAQYDNLMSEHEKLLTALKHHDSNSASLSEQYDGHLKSYTTALDAYDKGIHPVAETAHAAVATTPGMPETHTATPVTEASPRHFGTVEQSATHATPEVHSQSTVVEAPHVTPALEVIHNPNGVTIDPTVPKMYAWQIPGHTESYRVFYAANEDASNAAADSFLRANPNVPYVIGAHLENGHLIPQMHAQPSGLSTPTYLLQRAYNAQTGEALPDIELKDFIKY